MASVRASIRPGVVRDKDGRPTIYYLYNEIGECIEPLMPPAVKFLLSSGELTLDSIPENGKLLVDISFTRQENHE